MNLLLDTEALWHRPLFKVLVALHELGAQRSCLVNATVPAIAYAERLRQWRAGGREDDELRAGLARAGLTIEPFDAGVAERLDPGSLRDDRWSAHARDYLIAAHWEPGRIVVTADTGPAWDAVDVVRPSRAATMLAAMLH